MAIRPTAAQARVVFDNSARVIQNIERLASAQVLVGVPEKNAGRTEGQATNALLAYVHENGAPEHNIPARPFLRPGIRDKRPEITRYMRNAATAALAGNTDGMLNAMRAAGQTGASGAQQIITEGKDFAPLSERTILARLRKTQAGQARLRRMRKAGEDIIKWGAENLKPLLDTGALRRSISYVVRLRGRDV